ncbi:MAG TPA: fumarylacetoacetate hydrolase family protein [Xanthobacteraceae bacterium]|jgi:2-keto-4-pentenoate hydratase/2-oxohepta-3-ene-1,7-dioic acid hydratase in catechol pathway
MRLASFEANGRASYGAVTGAGIIDLSRKFPKYASLLDLFRAQAVTQARAAASGAADYQIKDVEMLPPIVSPEKNICVGINYPDRSAEYKDSREAPKYPNLFCRFPSSLVGSGQPIVRPKVSDKFDYEGEVILVIGKEGRHIPREQALSFIAGVTLGNEGSVRDWLRHGTLNVTQGKNFDRSGSVGPWIVTSDELDPAKPLHLTTRVNGERRQDDSTDRLTWGFAWLINYISTFATLKPGDLIWTGTPTGAGVHRNPSVWLKPGDVVEVEVPEIGVLRNEVVDET